MKQMMKLTKSGAVSEFLLKELNAKVKKTTSGVLRELQDPADPALKFITIWANSTNATTREDAELIPANATDGSKSGTLCLLNFIRMKKATSRL